MAKIRIASVGKTSGKKRGKSAISRRYVHGAGNRKIELFEIDSNDDNFDEDLTHVFSVNVEKARAANTAIFGSPDGPKDSSIESVGRNARKLK